MKQKRKNQIAVMHLEFLRDAYWVRVAKEVMCRKVRDLDSLKQPITPQEQQRIQEQE